MHLKKDKLFIKTLFILLLVLIQLPVQVFAQRSAKKNTLSKKTFTVDERTFQVLNYKKWYFKMSSTLSYINLGSDVDKALNQVESLFNGSTVNFHLLNYNPEFTLKTSKKVERVATNFLPTGNIGFGYLHGKHQFEFDFGVAGMVPLNTINVDTSMIMTEELCSDPNDCPMANLGFVNAATGIGQYNLKMVLNEEIWIFTPSLYYEYVIKDERWGRVSAGGSFGLLIVSTLQDIKFRFERTDPDENVYGSRAIEGHALSTAINDIGPIMKIFGSYRKEIYKIMTEFRLGFQYGYVDMHRDVDGSGTMYMGGNILPVSFSTSAMSVNGKEFKNKETTRLEMIGVFIQAGILF